MSRTFTLGSKRKLLGLIHRLIVRNVDVPGDVNRDVDIGRAAQGAKAVACLLVAPGSAKRNPSRGCSSSSNRATRASLACVVHTVRIEKLQHEKDATGHDVLQREVRNREHGAQYGRDALQENDNHDHDIQTHGGTDDTRQNLSIG
jgi:hypothetical protein